MRGGSRTLESLRRGLKSLTGGKDPSSFFVGRERNVMIHMAIYKYPHPFTLAALDDLISSYMAQGYGTTIQKRLAMGSTARQQRNASIREFVSIRNCEGILYIDDDMNWPHSSARANDGAVVTGFDPLSRLQGRDKSIIGALCTTRRPPVKANCATLRPDGGFDVLDDPEIIDPNNGTPFTKPMLLLGFGMVYVRRDAVLRMVEKFGMDLFTEQSCWNYESALVETFNQAAGRYREHQDVDRLRSEVVEIVRRGTVTSEDFAFCVRAHEVGLEVWVDPSFEVQHMGDYGWSRLDWMAYHEAETSGAIKAEEVLT